MVIINLLWVIFFANLYYGYHYTGKLYYFMYPDWILITNIVIGLTGIWIGTSLIFQKIKLITALLIDIPLLTIGFLLVL